MPYFLNFCVRDKVKGEGKFCIGCLQYNTNKHEGEVDDRLLLESADDAATANWGSKWKTPTKEQWEELINGCEWEWVKNDKGAGVDMKMGKSKANGNTILIPFSGYYNGEAYIKAEGSFWTSTLYTKNGLQAYFARVLTHNINCNNGNKKQGMPIRAVTTK